MPNPNQVDPLTTHVGRALTVAKLASGMSYRELSAQTGIAKSALQTWFAGTVSPTVRDMKRLCLVMGFNWLDVLAEAEAAIARNAVDES